MSAYIHNIYQNDSTKNLTQWIPAKLIFQKQQLFGIIHIFTISFQSE